MSDYVDMDEFLDDVEDRNRMHWDRSWAFLRHIESRCKAAQRRVRELYPRLYQGVDAWEIQQTIEEALYWLSIPKEWSQRYADEYVDDYFEGFIENMHYLGVDGWIEQQFELQRLKPAPDLDDERKRD